MSSTFFCLTAEEVADVAVHFPRGAGGTGGEVLSRCPSYCLRRRCSQWWVMDIFWFWGPGVSGVRFFLGKFWGCPKDKKCCHFYGVKHAKTSRSSKNFKMHACADQQRPAAMLCLRSFDNQTLHLRRNLYQWPWCNSPPQFRRICLSSTCRRLRRSWGQREASDSLWGIAQTPSRDFTRCNETSSPGRHHR